MCKLGLRKKSLKLGPRKIQTGPAESANQACGKYIPALRKIWV